MRRAASCRAADDAATRIERAGGTVLAPPFDIPVGRVAVASDPFGNVLVLIDLSKGRYATDEGGSVTAIVEATQARIPPDLRPTLLTYRRLEVHALRRHSGQSRRLRPHGQ